MSVKFMLLNETLPDRHGDVYVGFFSQQPFWWSKTAQNDYVFEDRRPFDALKVTCLFAQPWPEAIKAEGLFWVQSQPSIAFRLRIENGEVETRPAGKWLTTVSKHGSTEPGDYEIFTNRQWDSIYGDRIQRILFKDTGHYQTYLHDALSRCLVGDKKVKSL